MTPASWPSAREVSALWRTALGRCAESLGGDELGLFALPAPFDDPIQLLTRSGGDGSYWRPSDREVWAGLGVASRLAASGFERWRSLRQQGAQWRGRVRGFDLTMPGAGTVSAEETTARWFGGLSFRPSEDLDGPWQGFAEGEFVLPRWQLSRRGEESRLQLAITGTELRRQGADLLDGLVWQWGELCSESAAADLVDGEGTEEAPAAGADCRWHEQILDILDGIARGRFDKVVPARRVEWRLDAEPALGRLLTSLASLHERSVVFAFRRGGGIFLGATPELLIRLEGRRLVSQALAGSEGSGDRSGGAARLRARVKDRREHELVTRHLLGRLAPFCRRLEAAGEPRVLPLRHLLHLETPIEGELADTYHLLELAEAVHPTPAVAGSPVGAALEWLAANEPHPRGWYAAPIGWFDQEGSGELRVALRSMLLTRGRAYLYAGAGVVEGSDPEAEWRETELKLEPARAALSGALALRRLEVG